MHLYTKICIQDVVVVTGLSPFIQPAHEARGYACAACCLQICPYTSADLSKILPVLGGIVKDCSPEKVTNIKKLGIGPNMKICFVPFFFWPYQR